MMTKADLIAFERHIADLYDGGELPYLCHFDGGSEDQFIDLFQDIKPGDWVFATHRNHYAYLLHGGSPEALEQKILDGKSMYVFDRKFNFFSSSIVAATPSIAAGVAWALKRKGSSARVWCLLGDGAEDEGHTYEAIRYVDGWELPCTFAIFDNDRNVSASRQERRGGAFGFCWPDCVARYHYTPTYPHSGTGTPGWLKFKREAEVVAPPFRQSSSIPGPLIQSNDIRYMDAVKQSMNTLALDGAIFVGYNVRYASAYGSLKAVPEDQRLETPLAENLMAGISIGMCFEGFRPVVFFERHEFIFNALDAIINTADVLSTISDGEYSCPIIIKAVAGSIRPFYAGLTHSRDFSDAIRNLVSFPVYTPQTGPEVLAAYELARAATGPVMVSELKSLY
jgi:hypothetical protein